MDRIRIGTRGSALALWQANHVKARLEAAEARLAVELVVIKTKGDKILDAPLAKIGGKGLFVKEIEEALLRGDVDLAVHSMKDVPAEMTPGLVLAAISAREDPHDAIVSPHGGLAALPPGAHVGTSSLRRVCQLRARRPDLRITPLRGNVDTRLRRLDAGEFDAIVLAAAGLQRLGHGARIAERLPFDVCLPAIGQGALGLQARADDAATIRRARAAMHDETAWACVMAERTVMACLEGGCQTPMAAHAVEVDGLLAVAALVGTPDGKETIRVTARGPVGDPERVGRAAAEELLARGAAPILERCRTGDLVGGP